MKRNRLVLAAAGLLIAADILVLNGTLFSVELVVFCAVLAWANIRVGDWPQCADVLRGVLLMAPLSLLELGLLWAVFAPLSYWAPGFAEEMLFRSLSEDLWYRPDGSAVSNAVAALSLVVLTPIVEETIFRGWLLPAWSRRWSLRTAVIGTSLLFGLLHGDRIVGATIFGVVMALLSLSSRSLVVPIAAHVTMNVLAAGGELIDIGPAEELTGPALLATFRDLWWVGAIGVLVGGPIVGWFVRRTWLLITSGGDEPAGSLVLGVEDLDRARR